MPRKKRKSKLRPRTPSRIKKRRPASRPRSLHHPELWGLGVAVGVAIGVTGSTILGALLLVVGALLLSGASLGAILRRSHHQVRHAASRARRPRPLSDSWDEPPKPAARKQPVIDAETKYPDVVEPTPLQPSPLLTLGHEP